ncbi:hypothetical protein [Afipia clevelandensis]|uniref:hypothetical protein n=1 Tax=Afipia clevelandensis TaxID=1034 RepID=UPI0012F6708B|nr:hypothetical protein [Afipia clevelandensis]
MALFVAGLAVFLLTQGPFVARIEAGSEALGKTRFQRWRCCACLGGKSRAFSSARVTATGAIGPMIGDGQGLAVFLAVENAKPFGIWLNCVLRGSKDN